MSTMPSPVTSRITVRGRQVRYRVDGAGPPVILLHGISRSLEDWIEQHELLQARHRVYSMDLPGYGWSEPLAEPYTLPALARFVAEFLDAVQIAEPVHLVGNSLGGAVAMQLAVDAPDRIASLALVNSAGFGREVTIGLRLLAIRPLGRLLLRPSHYGARRVERSLFHDPTFVTQARVEHAFALAQRPHAAKVLLETARSLGTIRGIRPQWRKTLLRALAELEMPTLIVWGDRDLILPAAHLNAARTHLPRAQSHLFPNTGHMPQSSALTHCANSSRNSGKTPTVTGPRHARTSRRGNTPEADPLPPPRRGRSGWQGGGIVDLPVRLVIPSRCPR